MIDQEQLLKDLKYTCRFYHGNSTSDLDIDQEIQSKRIIINSNGEIDTVLRVSVYRTLEGKLPVMFNECGHSFNAIGAGLVSLQGCPRRVGLSFACTINALTSLQYLPERARSMQLDYTPTLGLLRICAVQDLARLAFSAKISMYRPQAEQARLIISKYLQSGRDGIIPCAAELHKAGFGGNAKL